ncbi:MAG TPA: Type 1 glutamine amidotransferase-like domain-containing protein [Propionibacteriaceae bacterium]|jgi:dipeptidase E|nr:Type 1 glutamine amidotransferase-like domain-containing protein [Propionibacteriaceae bacterium]
MRALLTSVGLANDSIRTALTDLLGRPISECTAVHVPTAVYGLPEGPTYATEMTRYWDGIGWADLGTLELTALPSLPDELWRPALEAADAILVAGGNSGYLSYWAHHTQFAGLLPGLLEKAVYVGVSAGSCLLTPAYNYDRQRLAETGVYYDDEYDEAAPLGAGDSRGVGLVDFHLRPHLNSTDFGDLSPAAMERAAAKVDGPLYAIDDQTALAVADGDIRVVSEGDWLLFNAEPDQEGS